MNLRKNLDTTILFDEPIVSQTARRLNPPIYFPLTLKCAKKQIAGNFHENKNASYYVSYGNEIRLHQNGIKVQYDFSHLDINLCSLPQYEHVL